MNDTNDTKQRRPAQARGLPAGFGLGSPMLGRKPAQPVQLGDYLDDAPTPPAVKQEAAPEPKPAPIEAEQPAAKPVVRRTTPRRQAAGQGGAGGSTTTLPASARSKFERSGPPRKQINMRPETLDRARELLWLVQEYGPQPDAKASEMFEALVDLLWDARGRLDLSDVPLRGKWGDDSARQFPQHLKNAFADAISAQAQKAGPKLAQAA